MTWCPQQIRAEVGIPRVGGERLWQYCHDSSGRLRHLATPAVEAIVVQCLHFVLIPARPQPKTG